MRNYYQKSRGKILKQQRKYRKGENGKAKDKRYMLKYRALKKNTVLN